MFLYVIQFSTAGALRDYTIRRRLSHRWQTVGDDMLVLWPINMTPRIANVICYHRQAPVQCMAAFSPCCLPRRSLKVRLSQIYVVSSVTRGLLMRTILWIPYNHRPS